MPATHYHRKIIRITALDSPNVRLAEAQKQRGQQPTNTVVIPGVLPYPDYQKRLATWDKVRVSIGLHACFWEGAEVLLFPPDWLNQAERYAVELKGKTRKALAIGIDPAEGGDKTAMAAIDHFGLIELVSKQTPDTNVITGEALAFMRKHNVPPEKVVFDRGGGGKEHADRLRAQGYPVGTVAFGEAVSPALKRTRMLRPFEERLENVEERYVYKNRRAEMYGTLRFLLDPSAEPRLVNQERGSSGGVATGFALPAEYSALRQQLAPIPLLYDNEGRLVLPPKNRTGGRDIGDIGAGANGYHQKGSSSQVTLVDLIGHSPDEADALVLAIHALTHVSKRIVAGAI